MALYQVSCFESLRNNNIPELEITQQVVQKIRESQELHLEIEEKKNKLIENYTSIKRTFVEFSKDMEQPALFYQPKVVSAVGEELKEQMSSSWKVMSEVLTKREAIQDKVAQF